MSSIDTIAFDWVARLDNAPLDISDAVALQHWLGSDVRHRGAFARAQSIWMSAGRVAALRGMPIHVPTQARAPSRRAFLRGAVAAGMAGAALIPRRFADASEIYHADSGLMRLSQPECGEIILDQGATLRVRRRIGPPAFDLLAGRMSLTAARVALPVNMDGLFVELQPSSRLIAHATGTESDALVLQGRAVSRCAHERMDRVLHARDWIRTRLNTVTVTTLCDDDIESAAAWSRGKLEFQSVDVADAVYQMNRYNARKIILNNASCAHRKISGIFTQNDPVGFARVLSEIFATRLSVSAENITVS
ncbi:FecR family protein [Brytella acorum]|uniref:DUF4880 domain-containing protein n=1 Tax=Brytella acorum TaxID=2959299 RepID=A0AA35Y4G7_9PROT|nr:DUF4880 domain-containing protein [Brytella acorum]MDF3623774.1 DUF4880 domain-containing protein [Brytella acorum]CAI9121802.1 DUF4880 domain-containing protein [Brytella acorum]